MSRIGSVRTKSSHNRIFRGRYVKGTSSSPTWCCESIWYSSDKRNTLSPIFTNRCDWYLIRFHQVRWVCSIILGEFVDVECIILQVTNNGRVLITRDRKSVKTWHLTPKSAVHLDGTQCPCITEEQYQTSKNKSLQHTQSPIGYFQHWKHKKCIDFFFFCQYYSWTLLNNMYFMKLRKLQLISIVITCMFFHSLSYGFLYASKTVKENYEDYYFQKSLRSSQSGDIYLSWWSLQYKDSSVWLLKSNSEVYKNLNQHLDNNIFPTIPTSDEGISFVINTLWWKENFIQALKSPLDKFPKIKIFGSDFRCPNQSYGSNLPRQDARYQSCMFESWITLRTNTQTKKTYTIKSDEQKTVTMTIFPVTDKKYIFESFEEYQNWNNVSLVMIDPIMQYHNLRINLTQGDRSNQIYAFDTKDSPYIHPIGKKYELVKYERINQFQQKHTIFSLLPYYQVHLHLTPWLNAFQLSYYSYTPEDNDGYYFHYE